VKTPIGTEQTPIAGSSRRGGGHELTAQPAGVDLAAQRFYDFLLRRVDDLSRIGESGPVTQLGLAQGQAERL